MKLEDKITLGVSCGGNIRALCMMLFSVMNSRAVPHRIMIRLEGDLPGFDDFYLAQAAEFARMSGIEFQIHVAQSQGIRAARDWLLDNCRSLYLWMVDDDVIVAPDCLENFGRCDFGEPILALQGTKPDLNNRRGYKDFQNKVLPLSAIVDGCSANQRYEQMPGRLDPRTRFKTVQIRTIDTGNVLLDVHGLSEAGIKFQVFDDSTNAGGEDTLFAQQIYSMNCEVRFCPWAVSYHLEKPTIRFNEDAARGELIQRSMDALGMSKELKEKMRPEMMSWVWQRNPDGSIKTFTSTEKPTE